MTVASMAMVNQDWGVRGEPGSPCSEDHHKVVRNRRAAPKAR